MTVPSRARRRPEGRYDEPSLLGQRVLAVVLTAMALAFVAALVSLLWSRFGGEQVRGRVLGFDVRSDSEVSLEVEVSKSAGAKAYCVIRAQRADGVEIARDVAVLDGRGTQERVVRGTFVLRTSTRAVSAELLGCTPRTISRDDPAP